MTYPRPPTSEEIGRKLTLKYQYLGWLVMDAREKTGTEHLKVRVKMERVTREIKDLNASYTAA